MKNKKRHKICKCKDQTRRLTKNKLEDHEEHDECMNFFEKCKMNMQLTPNFKSDSTANTIEKIKDGHL